MLDVTYEVTDDLAPGRLAEIDEDRGRIRVRLDRTQPLEDVVRQLNIEIERLMSSARWFQLWGNEIVSRDTPGRPLRIEYLLHDSVPVDMGVGVAEDKGTVRVYICPAISPAEFATWMNPATKNFLAGGCWFQLYAGEIIDNSPEPNKV
ncbi:hypothetical protein ACFWJU_05880 [Streptomyces mutabilis]|uniref:hypothetical protein n=1 Tax=Streptomyces mutabilis TaxID=67332 RepID=UPI00365F87D7